MKSKFPASEAQPVADELVAWLAPYCEPGFIAIGGSLRRGREQVSDVEILFVPRFEERPSEEIFWTLQNLAELALAEAVYAGTLSKRLNGLGRETWGEQNKLAHHTPSGIPVDFFTASLENWWNLLVCRTGPTDSNIAIASEARKRGWEWKPYSAGFSCLKTGTLEAMHSERDVFNFVNLPFRVPKER